MTTRRGDNTFDLTQDLVTLLRASNVDDELSGDEYGAAEINPKRPYGNSDVEPDIARLLGWETSEDSEDAEGVLTRDQRAAARALHKMTPRALQVVLSTGSFTAGTYRRTGSYSSRWERVTSVTDAGPHSQGHRNS